MKKYMTALLALALAFGALTACGAKQDNSEAVEVDLPAFYAELEKQFQWNEGYMVDLEGEMLESYYPGISDIPVTQFVAKAPMMSSVVNELVLMQCQSEEDAAEAAAILQTRAETQAEGGAWYPEPTRIWTEQSRVVSNGNYVMMVVGEDCDSIVKDFNALF